MSEGMDLTQEQAQKRLDQLVEAIDEAIIRAEEFADLYGLSFNWIPEHIGEYHGAGSKRYSRFEADEDSRYFEGEWEPSTWSSSSAFC